MASHTHLREQMVKGRESVASAEAAIDTSRAQLEADLFAAIIRTIDDFQSRTGLTVINAEVTRGRAWITFEHEQEFGLNAAPGMIARINAG
jgi:hypothetical protein